MHVEFQRFFPTKKTPTQKLQEPGSWARVSKSLEAGLSCHVGWTKDVSLGKNDPLRVSRVGFTEIQSEP